MTHLCWSTWFRGIPMEELNKFCEAHGERDRFESCLFMKDNSYSWRTYSKKNKTKKKLDREDVTTMFHDFQVPICLSVTWFPPLKCHDFKCMSSLCIPIRSLWLSSQFRYCLLLCANMTSCGDLADWYSKSIAFASPLPHFVCVGYSNRMLSNTDSTLRYIHGASDIYVVIKGWRDIALLGSDTSC